MTIDDLSNQARWLLSDVMHWDLTPADWVYVESAVSALAAALDHENRAELHNAIGDLEVLGPTRASRVRNNHTQVPPPIREMIDETIHRLARK
ncbi:CATRA system-associated protein [Frankia sp. CiP3]|uniref:CATRA system-associated protein n=1 Tax=Frankia sp. CiP3 TaxID=2880971 RepID=UPI001EF52B06|nr:CATRA system-associated protein [Frankia sp. CiP3]